MEMLAWHSREGIAQRLRTLRIRLRVGVRSRDVICASDRNAALIIYTLSNYEEKPTTFFLERARVSRRLPSVPMDIMMAAVEDEFLTAGLVELAELVDRENPSDANAMEAASNVLAEWDVVRWVHQQNACGVAPSTAELLDQFGSLPPCALARTSTGRPARTARMWASR